MLLGVGGAAAVTGLVLALLNKTEPEFAHHVNGKAFDLMPEFRSHQLDDHAGELDVQVLVDPG